MVRMAFLVHIELTIRDYFNYIEPDLDNESFEILVYNSLKLFLELSYENNAYSPYLISTSCEIIWRKFFYGDIVSQVYPLPEDTPEYEWDYGYLELSNSWEGVQNNGDPTWEDGSGELGHEGDKIPNINIVLDQTSELSLDKDIKNGSTLSSRPPHIHSKCFRDHLTLPKTIFGCCKFLICQLQITLWTLQSIVVIICVSTKTANLGCLIEAISSNRIFDPGGPHKNTRPDPLIL